MSDENINWDNFAAELGDHATVALNEALQKARTLPAEEREKFVEDRLREHGIVPEPGAVADILREAELA